MDVFARTATSRQRERSILREACAWTAAALVVELLVGWWVAGSVSLLADAGHVAHHIAAIFVGLVALRAGERAQTEHAQRAVERRAALLVGVLLVLAAPVLLWQVWEQWHAPRQILDVWMLGAAFAGLGMNLRVLRILRRCSSVLLRGISLHTFWDVASSVLVCLCGVLVMAGWSARVDAIGGLLVSVGVIVSGIHLMFESLFSAHGSGTPH